MKKKMVSEWKFGYKVVAEHLEGTLCSPCGGGLLYKIREATVPQIGYGPLAVFTNRKGAERFAERMFGRIKIFRCVFKESPFRMLWYGNYEKNAISEKRLLAMNPDCLLPETLGFASEVILLEEVKEEEE